MILQKGEFNGQQVIPMAVAEKTAKRRPCPVQSSVPGSWYEQIGFAYHDQWWTFATPHKPVSAIGVFGQFIISTR